MAYCNFLISFIHRFGLNCQFKITDNDKYTFHSFYPILPLLAL